MKKYIPGLFAAIVISATAISATGNHSTMPKTLNIISADTNPPYMHHKKNKDSMKWHKDSGMHRMDTTMHHDSM